MEDLEGDQEEVEDVVGGEELNVPLGVVQSGVQNVCGIYSTSDTAIYIISFVIYYIYVICILY